jgi:hypothetical protein
MADQQQNAVLNVVINGQQAISTFTQMNKLRNDQLALVKNLDKSAPNYQEQAAKLAQLNTQHAAWRKELLGVADAQTKVQPVDSLLGKLKDQAGGNDTISKLLGAVSSGYAAIVSVGQQAMQVVTGMTGAFKDHQELVAAVAAEHTELKVALANNIAAQEALAVSVAVETSAEELNMAALEQERLAKEEAILATQVYSASQKEAALATSGTAAVMKILKIALASTGIGLLIIAVAGLVAYFEQTNEGSKKFKVILAELNALFQQAMKLIAPIGKALFDTFTQPAGAVTLIKSLLNEVLIPLRTIINVFGDLKNGNFKKAWDDIKTGVNDFGENTKTVITSTINTVGDLSTNLGKAATDISKVSKTSFADAAKNAAAVTIARQNLTKEERLWSEEKIKQQGEVDLLTKKLKDQYLTEDQRVALSKQAIAIREAIFDKDIDIAKKNEALVEQEQAVNSKKDYQVITDAKNRVQEVINAKDLEVQGIINKQSKLNKSNADEHAAALKRAQDLLKENAKLTTGLEDLNAAQLLDTMATYDKEVGAAEAKYDALIKKQKDYQVKLNASKDLTPKQKVTALKTSNDDIDAITEAKSKAVADLRVKQEQDMADKIKGINEKLTVSKANEFDKQRQETNAQYDQLVKEAGTNQDRIDQAQKGRIEALNAIDVSEKAKANEEKAKLDDEYAELTGDKDKDALAAINKKYDDELKALEKSYDDKFKATADYQALVDQLDKNRKAATAKQEDQENKKKQDSQIAIAQSVENSIFTISANNRHAASEARLTDLENQRQAELSNANLTEAQKKAINDKYDKAEKAEKLKAWKADQKAQLEQAIIAGALAVVKALPNPWLAAAAGVAAAAQIAVIVAQKPPQFGDGGILPSGPSHVAGGMNIVDPMGNAVANIEGGEPILSKATYAANPDLVNALLSSGGHTIDYERVAGAATATRAAAVRLQSGSIEASGSSPIVQQYGQDIAELKNMVAETMRAIQIVDQKRVVLSTRLQDDHNSKMVEISDAVNG